MLLLVGCFHLLVRLDVGVRRDERGRYVALDWKLRELILAEEARRTPITAIAANISDVTSSVEVGRRSVEVRRGPSPPDHW